MQSTAYWTRNLVALTLALSLALGPGCATTKNVMNKATFGLVGSGDDAGRPAAQERKQAEKEERERQKAAEEQANKDTKAAKGQKQRDEEQAGGKRGFWSKATFGLVGGESEDMAAKKEAKRREKEEKKVQKRDREEEKRAAKQARKEEEAARKQAKKVAQATTPQRSETPRAKRSLWSKATFGLVGGESEDKAAEKEAKRREKEEKKAREQAEKEQRQAEKVAKKEAREQERVAAKKEEPAKPKRGLMSKMTFGLVGGKEESKEQQESAETKTAAQSERAEAKRAAKEEKKARKQAEKEQKEAAKQAKKKQREQEEAAESTQTGQKRSLMSKLTFGLVGGEAEESNAKDGKASVEEEMPASTPEPPVPMPRGTDSFDVQPASAMENEARKLAKLPFETAVSYDFVSAGGKPQAVASRNTYSKNGYGITDLGDVRIAVRDMTFSGGTRGGAIVISSEDRAKASGRAGIGNETFNFDYEKGVTQCTFGIIQFTIANGVMTIGGRAIPMGQGNTLVVLDEQGSVEGAYATE